MNLYSWDHLDLPCLEYPTGAIVVLAEAIDRASQLAIISPQMSFSDFVMLHAG